MTITVERITAANAHVTEALVRAFSDVGLTFENLEAFVGREENILLVAYERGEPRGLLKAHLLRRYDGRGDEILIHGIDVAPPFRRRRIATSIIAKLREIASAIRVAEIWVLTNRSNIAAVGLYESTGATAPHEDDAVFIYRL